MESIAGFLVVRLPEQNYDREGRGAYAAIAPRIGNIFYAGIDRMAWFDLDEDYYQKTLSSDLLKIRQSLGQDSNDFTGIKLCYDLQTARKVLFWSNRKNARNEIIALRSQNLVQIKNKSLSLEPKVIQWLGFDFVSLGSWSLLAGGIFIAPSYFLRWQKALNENGLMDDSTILQEYAEDYSVAAQKNGVEPLPEGVHGIEAIEIGRVLDK